MALYQVTERSFRQIAEASFAEVRIGERADLQRLLRTQIEVLGRDLYVLAEEFGDWEDSKRRIDLLAIDTDANLVVIELKRTHDGGHMELQAIRYASMVSTMTFDRAVSIHAEFLASISQRPDESRARILDFLGWDAPDEGVFAGDTRIVLVAADFGKELTTAVLWLRGKDIDIRCIRLLPYHDNGVTMIDVHQIIPLPEAHEYQVQLREKEQQERRNRVERDEVRYRFWQGLVAVARSRQTRHANIKPGQYGWLGASSGVRGLNFNYVIGQDQWVVELYIDRGDAADNKRIFDALQLGIAGVERSFGESLRWERLDNKRASRVKHLDDRGGYRSDESEWPAIHESMVDAMTRLEKAIGPCIESLDF